jgi:hypothetical protein
MLTPNRTNRRRKMVDRIRPQEEPTIIEPSRVRGRPFPKGNPGRRLGSKNQTTKMVEALVDGEAPKLTRKLLDLALGGDVRCLQFCLDRLIPQRRGRPLDLQLPKINSVKDVPTAMAAISEAVSKGDVTAEEASHLAHLLKTYTDTIIANDFAVRLENAETAINKLMKKNSNNQG